MNSTFKGTACGVLAAVTYGTNPLGAKFIYQDGGNANSVLFYRFALAAVLLAACLLFKNETFRISLRELGITFVLGVLFAASSLTYYLSFLHMDAGVASTLLFVYPVAVAAIMAVFFHEKISIEKIASFAVAFAGVALLCGGNGDGALSATGISLVMISSLTYAIYIVVVNRAKLNLSPMKLTFFALVFCAGTIAVSSLFDGNPLQLFGKPAMWGFALMLALVPTVFSLVLMTIAVRLIGSTPTAIMGSLEPLTAVLIGVCVFGEALTLRLVAGILLISSAVTLIVGGKYFHLSRYRSRAVQQHENFFKKES